jgi:hypothetical protein
MDVFKDGEGRALLTRLVSSTYRELREDPDFMAAQAGVNWAQAFKHFEAQAARDALAKAEAAQRHREMMAKQDDILRAVAKEKGVEEAPLRVVLKKLGADDTPLADIPARLNEAADELIRLRADLTRLRNDRPEFAAIRARALALIDKGEFDAARAELRKGREAARALREEISRSEAGFLADEARIDRLQRNYDDACVKFAAAGLTILGF